MYTVYKQNISDVFCIWHVLFWVQTAYNNAYLIRALHIFHVLTWKRRYSKWISITNHLTYFCSTSSSVYTWYSMFIYFLPSKFLCLPWSNNPFFVMRKTGVFEILGKNSHQWSEYNSTFPFVYQIHLFLAITNLTSFETNTFFQCR